MAWDVTIPDMYAESHINYTPSHQVQQLTE